MQIDVELDDTIESYYWLVIYGSAMSLGTEVRRSHTHRTVSGPKTASTEYRT